MKVVTSLGRIPLAGRLSAGAAKPVLFVVRGVFPPKDHLEWLEAELAAEADVVLAHLPGMHSPTLASNDVATMTAAFGEVMDTLLEGRRVALLGVSTGALVCLGLARRPGVRALALIDPFLKVGDCWALLDLLERTAPAGSPLRPWVEAVFGKGLDADYRHLLDGLPERAFVMVGETPLGARRLLGALPSLASEDERALWRAAPGVELTVCPGAGHNVPDDSRPAMLEALRRAIAAAG